MNRYAIFCIALTLVLVPLAVSAQDNPEQLKNEGNLLYRDGDIEGAIAKWQQAIAVDSTYSFAYNNIGIGLYDLGDYEGSAEYLRKAVVLDTTYAKAYNSLGNAYLALGEYDQALASYQTSLDYEPNDPETLTNLGNVYLNRGEYDQALQRYDRAIDRDSNYAPAHNNRGLILERRGRLDEAVDSFRRAIKADSELIDAYINLGAHYCNREDPDGKYAKQAIDYLEKAQEIDPENTAITYNIGLCYLQTVPPVPARARQIFTELAQKTPDDPLVHYALGHAYAATKMYDRAVKSFTEAFTLDTSFTNARIAIDEASKFVK